MFQGSQIAAPVVRNILEQTLRYMGIEKQLDGEGDVSMESSVPEVRGLALSDAQSQLTDEGFAVQVVGESDTVQQQLPKPGASLSKGSAVILYTDTTEVATVTVPDVTGMSLSQATQALESAGLNIEVLGGADDSGNTPASKQGPPAGTEVNPATTVRVEFIYMDGD